MRPTLVILGLVFLVLLVGVVRNAALHGLD
jgi:hypothetical protein